MLNDVFVLDAICHAYNFRLANRIGQPYANGIADGVFQMHREFSPPNRPDLLLDRDTFDNRICDVDVTGHSIFGESHTDAVIYHELPLYGYFKDGGSPLAIGEGMRDRWPGRVFLYGGISPHQDGVLDRIDELVEKHKISGIKLYPHDMIDGKLRSFGMDDAELMYPIFERVRKRGLRMVAIHKAIVMGPVPIEPYFPFEVGAAARAFPELTFEIVHGGWAFMEETVSLLQWHPNITVSTEGTTGLLFKAPRKFAEILGTLMAAGATDRILWAIGGLMIHSRDFEEAFWRFEMPQDLIDGYGFPPLTDEVKRGILGLNAARLLGLDVQATKSAIANDEFAKPRRLAPQWSELRRHAA
ncbi:MULTISPECIES: amidohydrolase family protein [unclassified Mesorhizobium]|uniref:amidohydrolase family protein n=1 Tax=unclassified Mesorhizobium TaxID=325217 RepID=UPI0016792CD4|nr:MULTISPECIES: amidohydrolase family protein [unclassified Mesorhizobium]